MAILGLGNTWEMINRFKKNPTKALTDTIINEPSIGAGSVIGGGSKIITKNITKSSLKLLPLATGAVGGILFGSMLNKGGGKQESDQKTKQEQDVVGQQGTTNITKTFNPQFTNIDARDYSRSSQSTKYNIYNSPFASIEGTAAMSPSDIFGGTSSNYPNTVNPYQGINPDMYSGQETDQGQLSIGSDMIIIAAALIGGAYFLTRRK